MKYLFNTNIKYMTNCGDRFIVTLADVDGKRKKSLMDEFGRISDDVYYDLKARLFDDFFDAQLDYQTNILLDRNGNVIFKGHYEVHPFKDGVALMQYDYRDRCYFLSETGEVFGEEFADVCGFANGLGVVELQNGKFCFVDRAMNIVSAEFEDVNPFTNPEYTSAVIDGKRVIIDRNYQVVSDGFIDENGKKQPYDQIMLIDENNIIWHKDKQNGVEEPYSYISIDGKKLGKSHKMIHGFCDGISRVQDKEGTSFVDLSGEYITTEHFLDMGNFSEGFGLVGYFETPDNQVVAIIKKDGSLLELKSSYFKKQTGYKKYFAEAINPFSDGFASIMLRANNYQIVKPDGTVLSTKYKGLGTFHSGCASFLSETGKTTFLRTNLERFKKEFDSAYIFEGEFAKVVYNGRLDAVNTYEIMLSDISRFVFEIEQNPSSIKNLSDEILLDENLLKTLISYASHLAELRQDKDFAANAEKIIQKLFDRALALKTQNGKIQSND